MLIRALWKLPASVRPKGVEAAAIIMTENPPLDRLEFRIGEAMDFRDMDPRPRDPR
jgi:hypothetical protein